LKSVLLSGAGLWYIIPMNNSEQKPDLQENSVQDPEQQNKKPKYPLWTLGDAGYAILTGVCFSMIPSLIPAFHGNILGMNLMAYTFQIGAFALIPLYVVLQRHRLPISALGFAPVNPFHCLLIGGICGAVLYGINLLLSIGVLAIIPEQYVTEQSAIVLLSFAETVFERIMLGFFLLILAPVSEEILFRAFLIPPLKAFWGKKKAILFSAMIFAAMHCNLVTLIPLLAGGIGFAWLYEKYHNIGYNIAAHMVWNLIALILYYVQL